jgi:hypothetical protein
MDLSFESLFCEEPAAPAEVAPPPTEPVAASLPEVEPVNDVTVPEKLLSQGEPVEVDPAGAKAAVDAIIKADGLFSTDKDAVMGALRGKSPAELAELRRQFQLATGRDLDGYVADTMDSGVASWFTRRDENSDVREAQALLAGDAVGAAIIGLRDATDGLGTDEEKIAEILGSLKDQEGHADQAALQRVAEGFSGFHGESLAEVLVDELEDDDEEGAAVAMLRGDAVGADLYRLKGAADGLGTDEEAIWKVLEDPRYQDPAQLEALKKRYAESGAAVPTLEQLLVGDNNESLTAELSDEDRDRAAALLQGNRMGAEAAKLQATMSGAGTDERELFAILGRHGADEQRELAAQWQLLYGDRTGAASLDAELHGELEGGSWWNHLLGEGDLDVERADRLRKDGKLDGAFALYAAMKGLGTDEALLKETLRGKSPAELAQLRRDYAALRVARGDVGDNESAADDLLTQDLDAETDGRDRFDLGQLMAGDVDKLGLDEAGKVRELSRRAHETWDFERGGGAGLGSRVVDLLDVNGLDSGELLDWQHEQVNRVAGTALRADGSVDAAALRELQERAGFAHTAAEGFRSNVDAVADVAPTVLATAAEAALLVGTDGAATPLLAALAAGAGEELGMLSKLLLKGGGYGAEEMWHDQAKVAAEAAAAGTMKLPVGPEARAWDEVASGAVKRALEPRAGGFVAHTAGEVVTSTAESAIKNSAADVVLDEGNVHGGNNQAGDHAGTAAGGVGAGVGKGAAIGAGGRIWESLFGD